MVPGHMAHWHLHSRMERHRTSKSKSRLGPDAGKLDCLLREFQVSLLEQWCLSAGYLEAPWMEFRDIYLVVKHTREGRQETDLGWLQKRRCDVWSAGFGRKRCSWEKGGAAGRQRQCWRLDLTGREAGRRSSWGREPLPDISVTHHLWHTRSLCSGTYSVTRCYLHHRN